MNDKISISVLSGLDCDIEIEELKKEFPNLKFDRHDSPPDGVGGDFTAFHGILIGLGGALISNIFSDFYQITKTKLFALYKKLRKRGENKARIFNLVLHEKFENGKKIINLMFIITPELDYEKFNLRLNKIKDNYLNYFETGKDNYIFGRPLIFFWDEEKNNWVPNIEKLND